MKLYFLYFFILFVFIINTQIPSAKCPTVCNCNSTPVSDQCFICLEKQFKRNFLSKDSCPCIQNYVQNYPPTDYCCAKNCTLCYWEGCYECRVNWTKVLIGAQYICSCKENYKYNPILNDCICLADYKEYYSTYYVLSRSQCYPCPKNCKCDRYGCFSCSQQTNRFVQLHMTDITCFCKYDYTEVNGSCVPTKNIVRIKCDSPRILLSNGSCVCIQPYYQDKKNNCKCKSILNPISYYLYLGICYHCPNMCECNKYGCVSCSVLANRIIKYNHCTCKDDIGIFQLNGQCVCVSPYNKACQCNNFTYPSLFTNLNNKCRKCPYGCICDENRCKQCNSTSNRNKKCQCILPSIQLDDLCIGCPKNFNYINQSCVCMQTDFLLPLYYDNIEQKCNPCPIGCECILNLAKELFYGCARCDRDPQRKIRFYFYNLSSNLGNFTCYCDEQKHLQQAQNNFCQCIPPYVMNLHTYVCECQNPYHIDNYNKCVCNSQTYYLYSDTDCRPCPLECNCTDKGCIACSTRTGRIILRGQSFNYICPCFPIQQTTNKFFCITCGQKQYLWQNQCIDCDSNCETCNENGCLTCKFSMNLTNNGQNNLCICSNNLYYSEGSCICQKGYFLNLNFNYSSQTCLACPLNCVNCKYNDQIQTTIKCIQCNIAAFRKNNISQQCPCIDYYVESFIQKSFCCHWSCKTCSISGCLSCIPFSYRQLNYTDPINVTCSCMRGFVQNHQIVCSCPTQTYRYDNQCQACPSYCLQCSLILQIISCTKCVDGLNRIIKMNQQISTNSINYVQIFDCVCAGGYQSYTNQAHCYPKSCQVISENGLCAICGPNRIQTRDVSYCNCTAGFYQDQSYICQSCSKGCIKCISLDICEQCDISNDYYLVFNKKYMVINCVKPDFSVKIFYQEKDYIVLEIKDFNNTNNSSNMTSKPSPTQQLSNKNLSIYLILLTDNVSVSTIILNVLECEIMNTNILFIKFNNLTIDQLNPFLFYINSTNQSGFFFQKYYLMKDEIYTKTTINYSGVHVIFIYLFIFIIIIISYILNILGEKHNQLMYYYQTIYFIAMNIKDPHMYLVPFLNCLRITTFNFTFQDSGSPFNSFISNWTTYFQQTYGNYRYFSVDNNLIRNAGLALYLAIQNLSLEILFRIIYVILFRSKHKVFAQKYKKIVYRSLQWMRKVTMYPLLFFSLTTLILYQRQYSLVDELFRQLNKRIAIGILIFYTISTFLQLLFEQISKIYRYQLLLEYFFDIANSVIIIYSFYSEYIIFALIPSMFLKGILQYVKYRVFMYEPNTFYTYIIILKSLQSLIIIPIYFCNLTGTFTLILVYILGILIFRFQLIKKKYDHANLEKKIGKIQKIEDSKQSGTEQKFVDIENKSQAKIQINQFSKE